jgi:hypothetical protein
MAGNVLINGVAVNQHKSPHVTKIPNIVLTRGSIGKGNGRIDDMPLDSGTYSSSPSKYEPMGYIDWKKSPVRKSNNAALLSTSK